MKKLLCGLLLVTPLLTGCWETARGEKVGVIVKCAYEGIFIKTFECELIRGGMQNGSGSFGKSFHFTAENPHDITILQTVLETQREVHISYHQELMTLARTETEDNSFLDSIS